MKTFQHPPLIALCKVVLDLTTNSLNHQHPVTIEVALDPCHHYRGSGAALACLFGQFKMTGAASSFAGQIADFLPHQPVGHSPPRQKYQEWILSQHNNSQQTDKTSSGNINYIFNHYLK